MESLKECSKGEKEERGKKENMGIKNKQEVNKIKPNYINNRIKCNVLNIPLKKSETVTLNEWMNK